MWYLYPISKDNIWGLFWVQGQWPTSTLVSRDSPKKTVEGSQLEPVTGQFAAFWHSGGIASDPRWLQYCEGQQLWTTQSLVGQGSVLGNRVCIPNAWKIDILIQSYSLILTLYKQISYCFHMCLISGCCSISIETDGWFGIASLHIP